MEIKFDSLSEGSCPKCGVDLEVDFEQYSNVYYKSTIEKAVLLWMSEYFTAEENLDEGERFMEILNEVKKREG